MSSRNSSGKKKDTSLRIRISTKKDKRSDKDELEIRSEDDPVIESVSEENEDESEEEVMPTKSRRSEPSFNRSAFSMPDDLSKLMSRVVCCSCAKQINPMNPGAVRRHPWLKVICCKKCYKFLKSGPFTRDEEGTDEQCRWCGDGGRLYGCDYCHNCFCRSCIKRNLGRSEAARMESEDDSKWKCYMCKPKKIALLQQDCSKILDYIAKEEKKEKEREERAKQREKEKMQKAKEEREERHREKRNKESNDDKESTSQRSSRSSLPAPKLKEAIDVKKEKESTPQRDTKSRSNTSPDSPVVIEDDSPVKPVRGQGTRVGTYSNPAPGQGVQGVKKLENGTFAVTVGPRPVRPVVAYAANSVPLMPKQSTSVLSNALKIQAHPKTASYLAQALTTNQARVPQVNFLNVNKQPARVTVPPNDMAAAYNAIQAHSIEGTVEKMTTVAQSLNLFLNSMKTDLAIAKISQNMLNARNTASFSLKKGLDVFFNGLREILNVQFNASTPTIDLSVGKTETSTPKVEKVVKKEDLNVSTIPICLDDSDAGDSNEASQKKQEGKKEKESKNDGNDDGITVVSDPEDNENEMEVEFENGDNNKVEKVVEDGDSKAEDSKAEDSKAEDSKAEDSKAEDSKAEDSKEEDSKEEEDTEKAEVGAEKKKGKSDNKSKARNSSVNKETVKDGTGVGDKTNDSENTAAELELLKEMADEINEKNEKVTSSPEKEDVEKNDNSQNSDAESDKTKNSSRASRRTRSKVADSDNETPDVDEKTKSDSKSKGKKNDLANAKKDTKAQRKDFKSENENKNTENENKNKQKKTSKADKTSDDTDSLDDRNDSKKSEDEKKTSKVPKKNKKEEENNDPETENSEAERQLSELVENEVSPGEDSDDSDSDDSDDNDEPKRRTRRKTKKGKSSATNDEQSSEGKKASKEKKSSKDKKSSTDEKSRDKKSSKDKKSPTDEQSSKDKKSSDSKKSSRDRKPSESKHSSKSSKNTLKSDDDSETQPSSKSDRKKSRTSAKKSSEEKEDPGSDSSSYDPELEKEIKSLAKDTKLRPRRACNKSKEPEEKTSSKGDKKGGSRKGRKVVEYLSSNDNDADDVGEDNEQDSEGEEQPKGGSSQETDESEDVKKGKKGKGKKAVSFKEKKKSIIEDLSSDDDVDNEEEPEEDEEDDDDTDEEVSPSKLRALKANQKSNVDDSDDNSEDFMEEEGSCDSSDPEVSFPNLKSPKKGKKEEKPGKKGKKKKKDSEDEDEDEMSDDSDFVTKKSKKKKKVHDELLDVNLSDDDSDVGKKRKGKGKGKGVKKRKRKEETEEEEEEDEEPTDKKKKGKGKGKKRRRIKKMSSSDDEKEPGADDEIDDGEYEEDPDGQGGFLKRRKIRKVQANKKLADETKAARKAEEERRKRIEDRQKEYNSYVEVEGGESEEELPEGTERHEVEDPNVSAIAEILGSPKKIPVTTKCILEMDKDKKPLIEVNRTLIRKLKPHQVEAVRFMYNCCIESMERMKKGQESGCILAHCMGLGKTLSVISFVHTMLSNVKHTGMTKCLVVCPLNTVLNWVNEFEIWLADVDFEIQVFEMSRVKVNFERAQMLKEWHEGGAGVMILGYDMYRNLVQGSHCKNKKQKKIFYETLAEPGPDIVICDEGHILKNDQTSLSKSMVKIKSQKRVVLTGTPLQNNLGEYHCMVNFVKPNLLGTRKEFANRFVNPITNGQCSDSTPFDVKLMKRRAHILHELLAGCVQRKDYSALTKFLPPKLEYVISVRLSKTQMDLYDKYLEQAGAMAEVMGKGARLFKDYQALMRIWTHPWVLKLDEIRQENKKIYDDTDDSFVDDESDGEDSFISNSTSSSDSESDQKKKKKRKKGGGTSSSDEDKKNGDANDNEVVKKWTSRRRGNEEGAGSSWMEDMGYAPEGPKEVSSEWWAEYVKEEDEFKLELSGKLMLLFQILKMCEDIGDKVLVFSQSLLSLDIIEDFLQKIDEANNGTAGEKKEGEEEKKEDGEKEEKKAEVNGDVNGSGDKAEGSKEEEKEDPLAQYGKSWTKGADYFRMDGSTSSQHRKAAQDMFNDPENYRSRLFLISTKAGSLGINLVSANRVIIFDASWNPSHDIQSIFRVYRFGQVKPVYVYRFLAQGTMEEKIYERQVTKQSLSQRVVDEHQIERHFTSSDLQELYRFTPDRLDDPDRKEQPLPMLPKDHMLAELMSSKKEWIVTFHEHDSLLENIVEQELSEEEKKAAWEDYEEEKKGRPMMYQGQGMFGQNMAMQNMAMQGRQPNIDPQVVMQIVQDLKTRYPNLPPEIFQQRVQAVLRQVLTTQIMQQTEMQRRQIDQQKMNELNRLNQLKQQIQQQQAMVNSQQQVLGMSGLSASPFGMPGASGLGGFFVGAQRAGFNAPNAQMMAMSQQMKNLQADQTQKKS